MDYFKQRRAYRDLKMYEMRVSASQNNLYRELLDYANDKMLLDKSFRLTNDAVLKLTGLSTNGLVTARNKLQQDGLIEYEKGKRNLEAPIYKVTKLYDESSNNLGKSQGNNRVNDRVSGRVNDRVTNLSTSTQLNLTNTKHHQEEDDDSFKNLITIYQQNIGVTTPVIIENIRYAINDFKEHENTEQQAIEIVEEAIRITAVNNAHSWKYTNKILMNWLNDSLFTLPNIKAAQNKPKPNSLGKPKRVEQATNWSKYSAGKQTQTSKNTEISDDMKRKLAEMRNKESVTK